MTETLALVPDSRRAVSARIAGSALARDGVATSTAEFHRWLRHRRAVDRARVRRIALDDLSGWRTEPGTGDLVHDSGRFFSVQGLAVDHPGGPVPHWTQPIINQPEIGILGILVREIGGVLHCLMQAKNEPGNHNGVQLSPTVQATRSNYTRVHRGRPVPYLEYFQDRGRHHVVADVLQSEQGSWFYRKRNRNMVVEVDEDVPLHEGFCWLTVGQLHRLLGEGDVVNMDARTVLSCLPFSGGDLADALEAGTGPAPASPARAFGSSIIASCGGRHGAVHGIEDVLSWITDRRSLAEVRTTPMPLARVTGWTRGPRAITHDAGLFFTVIGVAVEVAHREVARWTQPMIAPCRTGVAAFLVRRVQGVLHVLVRAEVEPGYVDVVELGPTVHCTPANYDALPAEARPPFLDAVLAAAPERVRFDAVLSEEGGRFHHARTRYVVVEAEEIEEVGPDYRWLTLHQLVGLLQHSHYLNVQARTLIACLHGLAGRPS